MLDTALKKTLPGVIVLSSLFTLSCDAQTQSRAASPRELLQQAEQASAQGDSARSVELAGQAIRADSRLAAAYYLRGRELLRLGKFQQAVEDLDRYVALQPEIESTQWERGIAYYYAGQYAKGARQFELYQSVDGSDVENAVWHFLCVARGQGLEQARQRFLPVQRDPRIPLMEIYDLFRGKADVASVLKAARAGEADEAVLAARLFYANLYIGLYYDALGQPELARTYLEKATRKLPARAPASPYMWDIARVHVKTLAARTGQTRNPSCP